MINKTTYVLANASGDLYLRIYTEECGMLLSSLGRKGEVTPRMLREESGLTKSQTRRLIEKGVLDVEEFECGRCHADCAGECSTSGNNF
jgi:predicted PP-loop superfamily ATPase